ncbi:uncharacterized protein LOC110603881 [Manihot esculenta]|uniref:uncharacterized protein LOC110603881 n=1 Tax=Manihot esculenta TaxID=3983 RepID=UPI000B5D6DBD|nr:uncharacterized protein LOC110603881 [Manihot esculenta]
MVEVLVTMQDKNLITWRQPLQSDLRTRDPNQYYQFHKTNGHSMNNCYQLRNEIGKLIKWGHLKIFVKKKAALENRPEERREPVRKRVARLVNDGSSETINMIVRKEIEQPLQANRKRRRGGKLKEVEVMQVAEHIPRVVSFSVADGEGVRMPHDDA